MRRLRGRFGVVRRRFGVRRDPLRASLAKVRAEGREGGRALLRQAQKVEVRAARDGGAANRPTLHRANAHAEVAGERRLPLLAAQRPPGLM